MYLIVYTWGGMRFPGNCSTSIVHITKYMCSEPALDSCVIYTHEVTSTPHVPTIPQSTFIHYTGTSCRRYSSTRCMCVSILLTSIIIIIFSAWETQTLLFTLLCFLHFILRKICDSPNYELSSTVSCTLIVSS